MTADYQRYLSEKQLQLLQLFFCLIRVRVPEDRLGRLVDAGHDVDWGVIVGLAQRYRMLPILYVNLKKLGWRERIPAEPWETLRLHYLRVTAANMRMRQRLVEVVDVLERAGVEVAPFKGPLLGEILYEDSLVRSFGDLDLLIPGSAVGRAWEALTAGGYRPKENFLNKNQFTRYAAFEKEFDFEDAAGRVNIDLHWRLTSSVARPFDYDFCRKRLRKADFYGRALSCLSDEDMVVYLCLHGAYHLWPSVESVLCVAEYIERRPGLDWDLALKLADELRCRRMLLWGLLMARDMFATDLPEPVARCVAQDRAAAEMAGEVYADLFGDGLAPAGKSRGEGRIEQHFFQIPRHLKARQSPADKIRYLLWMMFWPSKREWMALPLPARLTFLYFIFRPLRMAGGMAWGRLKSD